MRELKNQSRPVFSNNEAQYFRLTCGRENRPLFWFLSFRVRRSRQADGAPVVGDALIGRCHLARSPSPPVVNATRQVSCENLRSRYSLRTNVCQIKLNFIDPKMGNYSRKRNKLQWFQYLYSNYKYFFRLIYQSINNLFIFQRIHKYNSDLPDLL